MAAYYARYGSALSAPQAVSVDEFLDAVVSDEKYRLDPMGFADELEQLLIEGYAETLVTEHL